MKYLFLSLILFIGLSSCDPDKLEEVDQKAVEKAKLDETELGNSPYQFDGIGATLLNDEEQVEYAKKRQEKK